MSIETDFTRENDFNLNNLFKNNTFNVIVQNNHGHGFIFNK